MCRPPTGIVQAKPGHAAAPLGFRRRRNQSPSAAIGPRAESPRRVGRPGSIGRIAAAALISSSATWFAQLAFS